MENINVWVYIGVIGSGKDYNAQKKQKETGGNCILLVKVFGNSHLDS